jgi:hypothetical protein
MVWSMTIVGKCKDGASAGAGAWRAAIVKFPPPPEQSIEYV